MKEINAFYNVERAELPVGSLYGSDIENLNSLQAGAGTKVMRADDSGLWLGAETFAAAPFSVDMSGNVVAASLTASGYISVGGAAADVNGNATTIDGGKITALSVTATQIAASAISTDKLAANAVTAAKIAANTITANEIASGTITATQIASNAITASKIQAGAVSANKLDSDVISGGLIIASLLSASNIQTGTLNASLVSVTNLNASNINTGTLSVGGTGKPSYLIITQSASAGSGSSGAYMYFGSTSGAKIWADTNNDMGLNAVGGEMYFYCNSAQILYLDDNAQAVIGQDNATYDVGLYVWGNLNQGRGDVRFKDAQVRINTSSSPSEQLYVEGSGKFIGNITTNHHDPRSANSYNQGGSSLYWAYVNCHDVTYHSLGFYDDGVTVEKDGKLVKVSDVEAIKMMKPHPTLKTKDGAPLLDKFSLPKEMFESAKRVDGTEYRRDPKTGYPIVDDDEVYFDKKGNEKRRPKKEIRPDADGQSGAQLLALALGAVRELDGKIEALQDELAAVKSSVANRPVKQ